MKRIGLAIKAFLMIGFASFWLTPCSGMDAMTQSELGELSGQSGISIGFPNTVKVTATFNSISFGDSDGWGTSTAIAANPGWLILIGRTGTQTGSLSNVIPKDTIMTIDVGSTGGSPCYPMGQATHPGFVIPANRSFFTFSLTDVDIELVNPDTVKIVLANTAYPTLATTQEIGWITPRGVSIDLKATTAADPSRCYVWAHAQSPIP